MKTYEEFKNIKIEDTGVMNSSLKDTVFYRLYKNNITTLQQLFQCYENELIYYGAKSGFSQYLGYIQTIGVVKLLRAHYLNEDLPYINIIEGVVNDRELLYKEDGKNIVHNFNETFLNMGFSLNFILSMKEYTSDKLILVKDLLEKTYKGEIIFNCNRTEKQKNLKRLEYLLEWYYNKTVKLSSIKLEDLNKLKEEIIKYKNIKDKDLYVSKHMQEELNLIIDEHLKESEDRIKVLKMLKNELNN